MKYKVTFSIDVEMIIEASENDDVMRIAEEGWALAITRDAVQRPIKGAINWSRGTVEQVQEQAQS